MPTKTSLDSHYALSRKLQKLREVDWQGEGLYREEHDSVNDANDRVTVQHQRMDKPENNSSDNDLEVDKEDDEVEQHSDEEEDDE